ncbi:hypothetical protein BXZ70DRAFT_1004461 [Cristinia sonorae]|uniref:RNase III domain-containing protein n=1 Tax=Cristinia sonorae TaxID=1940300 RepID=A0A8K0XUG4_9AGAR|nr:hypothetical protein BXZ70DRAFT_1004461 [Cristinia sonorae]
MLPSSSNKRPRTSSSVDEQQPPHKKHRDEQGAEHIESTGHDTSILVDGTTGKQLRPQDAEGVIRAFFDKIGMEHPIFTTDWTRGGFLTKATFAQDGPFRKTVTGKTCCTKESAREAVCFQLCRKLFKRGLLDHTLFPRHPPSSPPASTSGSSKTAAAVHQFPKKAAFFWTHLLGSRPKRLYPSIVSVHGGTGSSHASFAFLTKRALPPLPSFTIFEDGHRATVSLTPGAPFKLDEQQLSHLHGYTTRVFRSVTNKPFSVPVDVLSYLVAPLSGTPEQASRLTLPNVFKHIAWDSLEFASQQWKIPLLSDDGTLSSIDEETVIQDRAVEFTNRFYLRKVRRDICPKSKMIDNDEEEFTTYLERCKARVRNFPGLRDEEQPMLEVDPVPGMYNNFNPHYSVQPPRMRPKFLIPELCHKFVIPASLFRTFLLLPSIIFRVDQLLVMTELNDCLFDNKLSAQELLLATTPVSAHGDFDYERLEFLGDASLKFMSSTYCYLNMPQAKESALHDARQKIISNRALYHAGVQAGMPTYIQSKPFIPKIWQPDIPLPRAGEQGEEETAGGGRQGKRKKQKESRSIQWLGEKTVADVVEALVAVAYLSGGNDAALRAAKALSVPLPDVNIWSDFRSLRVAADDCFKSIIPASSLRAVEKLIGKPFTQPGILAQAFTHPSKHSKEIQTYEQLEFLGDATLDFLASRYVYVAYPNLAPGGMTMLKAAMVSNQTLATICVMNGLHRHLMHSSNDLARSIEAFETQLKVSREKEQAKARAENRPCTQYWLELAPCKPLSDVLEAILGAIYVDDGFEMNGSEAFFSRVFKPFYEEHITLQSLSHHPGKTLYDLFSRIGCREHKVVKDVVEEGVRCDVIVHGVILATATDSSSSLVVRRAAAEALDALQGDPGFIPQTCNCKTSEGNKKQLPKAQLGYEDA